MTSGATKRRSLSRVRHAACERTREEGNRTSEATRSVAPSHGGDDRTRGFLWIAAAYFAALAAALIAAGERHPIEIAIQVESVVIPSGAWVREQDPCQFRDVRESPTGGRFAPIRRRVWSRRNAPNATAA